MIVWAILGGLAAGSTLRLRGALADLEANPLAVTPSDLARLEDITDTFAIVQVVAFCVTALVFVIWFRRMHVNLRAFGELRTEYSNGWAVGAWLVPFLNFVRPKQIADDIWRRSDPERSREVGYQGGPLGGVPRIIHVWWAVYLGAGLSTWGARAGSVDSVSGATARATWWFVGDLLQIAVGVITLIVVAMFTERQGRRAEVLQAHATADALDPPAPAPGPFAIASATEAPTAPPVASDATRLGPAVAPQPPSRRRYVWAAATTGAALAAIAVAASVIDEPADAQTVAGAATIVFDLEPGDCFDFPDSIDRTDDQTAQAILAVDVVGCDEPHAGEMVADTRWPQTGGAYPGDDALLLEASDLCMPHLQEYVGANILEAGLDIFVVVPDRVRWAEGSRDIQCLATSLDAEATLSGSLRGARTALAEGRRTWWSLQVGDCFDEPVDRLALVMDVVSCAAPHDYETFAVLTHPAGPQAPYPGETDVLAWAQDQCAAVYVDLIDRSKSANLDYSFGGVPVAQTWAAGHRTVTCVLWNQVGPLTESVLAD